MDKSLKIEDHSKILKNKKFEKIPTKERQKIVNELRTKMITAAKKLEFEEAARLRDEIEKIKKMK